LESKRVELPWQQARPSARVKLLSQEKELYIFVESADRLHKERALRLRKLRDLIKRLQGLQQRKKITRNELLLAGGQAKEQAGRAYRLLDIHWPEEVQEVTAQTFTFRLDRARYRRWQRREWRYLLRTNLTTADPKALWEYYLQPTVIEAAFKNLKGDLRIRPIFHQNEARIEAHIFVAYLAYCLHVTLQAKLRQIAGGLTPRSVLEKLSTMHMMNVHFPTEEPGKELVFRRHTQPEKEHQMILSQLGWQLPEQAPPRITQNRDLLS
jgi:transposase